MRPALQLAVHGANTVIGSHFGHDKSLEIRPYAALPIEDRPTLLYAGDGISDLSAAAETDLLFAKKGNGKLHHFIHHSFPYTDFPPDLVEYCQRKGMPFTIFDDWSTILETTKDIHSGKVSVKNVAQEGERTVHRG